MLSLLQIHHHKFYEKEFAEALQILFNVDTSGSTIVNAISHLSIRIILPSADKVDDKCLQTSIFTQSTWKATSRSSSRINSISSGILGSSPESALGTLLTNQSRTLQQLHIHFFLREEQPV